MSKYEAGDMVVLISGSMRMAVESVEEETVNVVWCHEGRIGRDSFDEKLLNKWETREYVERAPREDRGHRDDRGPRRDFGGDDRGPRPPRQDYGDRGGDRGGYKGGGGGYKGGYKGGDDRGPRPYGGGGDDRGPRGKTGWDGRPREKKFYRADD